nr:MAG TPA: hypothetical protein [Caudoviricetes sp.]
MQPEMLRQLNVAVDAQIIHICHSITPFLFPSALEGYAPFVRRYCLHSKALGNAGAWNKRNQPRTLPGCSCCAAPPQPYNNTDIICRQYPDKCGS